MKCTCCGGEVPENENLCPFCGENISLPESTEALGETHNKKKIAVAVIAAALCLAAVGGGMWFLNRNTAGVTAEEAAAQNNMISYTTKKAIHTLLPENHKELTLYINNAKDMNSYSTFDSIISSNSTYIGQDNFIRLKDEVLYLETSFKSYSSSTGSLEADYTLYSVKNGKDPVVVDEGVQGISCASDKSIYYIKVENGMSVQYRYRDGETNPCTELVDAGWVWVSHCSDDDSVIGFAAADFAADGSYTMNNGYIANGTTYRFGNETYEVYFISKDGKHIYVVDIESGGSRAVEVYYVTDHPTGEMANIASNVTEISFYESNGSMTCIGDVELSDEIMNPIGKVQHFEPETQTLSTIAPDAVALVEAMDKTYTWLNEDSLELLITEQSNLSVLPQEIKEGQYHFISKDGALCAADENGTVFEIAADFYVPESYVYASDIYYMSEQHEAIYWAKGDQVYKYTTGSLSPAESVTLDSDLLSKIESGTEIGYMLCGDGSVLEQSGNTLNRKPFGGVSSTVYDSPENIYITGISTKGDKLYFYNEQGVLYEKVIDSDAAPTVVAENVYKSVTVGDGLYLLVDYSEDEGGRLLYRGYDSKELKELRSGVTGLQDTMIQ